MDDGGGMKGGMIVIEWCDNCGGKKDDGMNDGRW